MSLKMKRTQCDKAVVPSRLQLNVLRNKPLNFKVGLNFLNPLNKGHDFEPCNATKRSWAILWIKRAAVLITSALSLRDTSRHTSSNPISVFLSPSLKCPQD